jgi:hypothetical protein
LYISSLLNSLNYNNERTNIYGTDKFGGAIFIRAV